MGSSYHFPPLDTPSTEALRSRRYTVGACEHMGAQGNAGYSGRHRKRVWRSREADRQSEPTNRIGAEQTGSRACARVYSRTPEGAVDELDGALVRRRHDDLPVMDRSVDPPRVRGLLVTP